MLDTLRHLMETRLSMPSATAIRVEWTLEILPPNQFRHVDEREAVCFVSLARVRAQRGKGQSHSATPRTCLFSSAT